MRSSEMSLKRKQQQAYIEDSFDTMAESVANRFCLSKEAVKKWLNKKGYTVKDFGEVIQETKRPEWLGEVIWS